MSNKVYIFKPLDVARYYIHFDPVQGFVDAIVAANPNLFEKKLRFFAYLTSPMPGRTDYDRAGLIYRRELGYDDPLKDCTPYELFRKMNKIANKLGTLFPRNPSTAPALEVSNPTTGQYNEILDIAVSETFSDLGAELPEEVGRFVALMCSEKTLDGIVFPHLQKIGLSAKVEIVRN